MADIARDVVIIGANSAGLTAANELRMAGLSVAVVEAGERIGDDPGELQLLVERLGEDVMFGHTVHSVQWAVPPRVTAICAGLTVHTRFAILAHDSAAAVVVPSLPPARVSSPVHLATDEEMARAVASTIVHTAQFAHATRA